MTRRRSFPTSRSGRPQTGKRRCSCRRGDGGCQQGGRGWHFINEASSDTPTTFRLSHIDDRDQSVLVERLERRVSYDPVLTLGHKAGCRSQDAIDELNALRFQQRDMVEGNDGVAIGGRRVSDLHGLDRALTIVQNSDN
jgi:hypothetical protein